MIEQNEHKTLSAIFILILSISSNCLAIDTDLLNKRITKEQNDIPKGDVHDIKYVKQVIDYMYNFDQEIRLSIAKEQPTEALYNVILKMDEFHTEQMKKLLLVHKWITISKFGKDYDNKAWLLVQHSDQDPFFQAGCLFLLSNLITNHETDKKNYALLYDRVVLKFPTLGLKQRYGS